MISAKWSDAFGGRASVSYWVVLRLVISLHCRGKDLDVGVSLPWPWSDLFGVSSSLRISFERWMFCRNRNNLFSAELSSSTVRDTARFCLCLHRRQGATTLVSFDHDDVENCGSWWPKYCYGDIKFTLGITINVDIYLFYKRFLEYSSIHTCTRLSTFFHTRPSIDC